MTDTPGLKARLRTDLTAAMKARDTLTTGTQLPHVMRNEIAEVVVIANGVRAGRLSGIEHVSPDDAAVGEDSADVPA